LLVVGVVVLLDGVVMFVVALVFGVGVGVGVDVGVGITSGTTGTIFISVGVVG